MNDRFLRACRREPVDRTPLWIMRQAGRYLPEYREVRSRHDFLTVCRTPELAAEVTLQPLRRFKIDAAILFSDIMVPLDAFGIPMTFEPGPKIADPIRTRAQVDRLAGAPGGGSRAVCRRRDSAAAARARRPHAVDWLLRRAVHHCRVPGAGRGQGRLQRDQAADVSRARDARSAAREALRGDGGLPAAADRRRRAGGPDLRFVGRHPRRGRLPPVRIAGREVPGRHGA